MGKRGIFNGSRCQWLLQLENGKPYWNQNSGEIEFSKWCNSATMSPSGWNFVHQFDVFWYLLIFRSISTFCQGMNSLFFKMIGFLNITWRFVGVKRIFSPLRPRQWRCFFKYSQAREKNKYTWWFQNGRPQSTRNSSHFASVENNLLHSRCSALKCSDILTTLGYPKIPVARVWSCFLPKLVPPPVISWFINPITVRNHSPDML